jgi:predicted RNase H-like HicB family nuclease
MSNSKSLTYKLLLHKEPEGAYTVMVPALPGCITYGEDIDQAIEMAKEAIELYISSVSSYSASRANGFSVRCLKD